MIDTGKTTLESNYWIGAQGGGFWIGQVEGDGDVTIVGSSMQDVSASNRVKVRIVGYHSRDRKELPPEDLPWATVMMPSNAPTVRNAGTVHGYGGRSRYRFDQTGGDFRGYDRCPS